MSNRSAFSPTIYKIMNDAQIAIEAEIKHPVTVYFKVKVHDVRQEDIIKIVCEYFKLTWSEITSSKKEPNIIAKQIFIWIAKNYCRTSLTQIALTAGLADHTSASSNIKVVREMIETANPKYLIPLNEIETKILHL